MATRAELIVRAAEVVARQSNGQATERDCEHCAGGTRECRKRCASSPTGWDEITPCPSCDGFGVYWQVRDTSPGWTVTTALGLPPPVLFDSHAQHS